MIPSKCLILRVTRFTFNLQFLSPSIYFLLHPSFIHIFYPISFPNSYTKVFINYILLNFIDNYLILFSTSTIYYLLSTYHLYLCLWVITLSISPYFTASSAVMKKSLSVSFSIISIGCPVCKERVSFSLLFILFISFT